MKPYQLFIVVQPGLERFAIEELSNLGIHNVTQVKGALVCKGHLSTVIRINIYCRCISRVLIDLGSFYASNFRNLHKELGQLPWQEFIPANNQLPCFTFRVSSYDSALYHEKAIAERVMHSLADIYKQQVSVGPIPAEDTQLIQIHNKKNQFTIRLDSSGTHLHKRGYGKYTEEAPLRETIAAAMIYASGWLTGSMSLCDPMCGSGTIAIEAALQQSGVSWDSFRDFRFMSWKSFTEELMLKAKANFGLQLKKQTSIIGSDIDPKAVSTAKTNAEKAGVCDKIEFQPRDIAEYSSADLRQSLLIMNPPWGKRLKDAEGIDLLIKELSKKAAETILITPNQYAKTKTLFQVKSGDIGLRCIKL